MVYGQFQVNIRLEHKEYDAESETLIKFYVHPNSAYEKTWFTNSSENPKSRFKILHKIKQLIRPNKIIQIVMTMSNFYVVSSVIFTDFFSNIPIIKSDSHNKLADDLLSKSHNLIESNAIRGNKSVEISVEIQGNDLIYLDKKDMQVVDKYDTIYNTIPASPEAVAVLERVGESVRRLNGDICSICWEEDSEGWDALCVVSRCRRVFLKNCLMFLMNVDLFLVFF